MRRRYWFATITLVVITSLVLSNVASATASSSDSEAFQIASELEPPVQAGSTEQGVPAAAAAVAAGLAVRHAARAYGPAVAQQYVPAAVAVAAKAVTNAVRAVTGDSTVFLAGTDSRIPSNSHGGIDIDAIFDE